MKRIQGLFSPWQIFAEETGTQLFKKRLRSKDLKMVSQVILKMNGGFRVVCVQKVFRNSLQVAFQRHISASKIAAAIATLSDSPPPRLGIETR